MGERPTPTDQEQLDARGWRDRREKEFPPVTASARPSDYAHDFDRGTIDFDPAWKNYSFHKVRIDSGQVVRGCNFSQAVPKTEAIIVTGDPGKVTFEDCNLCNVMLDTNWTVTRCLTSQAWIVEREDKREKRQFICSHPDELPARVTPPANAITSRNF